MMYMASLLIRSALFFCFILICGRAQNLPGLYVFGDSIVDVGNNNYIPLAIVRADFPYHGIDFTGGKSTGRFSNGKNFADLLAEKVGLPLPPPYLSQPKNIFLKGASFASGGARILNITALGIPNRVISMTKQIEYFADVRKKLVEQMLSVEVQEHLSKSLSLIVMGSNDIIFYFRKDLSLRKKCTPLQYVTLMVTTLKQQIKNIYDVGGRKFIIIGISPIGCTPRERLQNATNECNEEVNYWSNKFNEGLTQMLPELQSELKDFHYSYFDIYNLLLQIIHNPKAYGFNEVKSACCGLGKLRADLPCSPLSLYCLDRSSHVFWDFFHPTEATARKFVDILFDNSTTYVTPIALQQLITL